MLRTSMLVVFAGCTLMSMVAAALVLSQQQVGGALLFGAFGLLFGCLTAALLQGMRRRKSPAVGDSADITGERPSFVPHWFLMTALTVTAIVVLVSILWRLWY